MVFTGFQVELRANSQTPNSFFSLFLSQWSLTKEVKIRPKFQNTLISLKRKIYLTKYCLERACKKLIETENLWIEATTKFLPTAELIKQKFKFSIIYFLCFMQNITSST